MKVEFLDDGEEKVVKMVDYNIRLFKNLVIITSISPHPCCPSLRIRGSWSSSFDTYRTISLFGRTIISIVKLGAMSQSSPLTTCGCFNLQV